MTQEGVVSGEDFGRARGSLAKFVGAAPSRAGEKSTREGGVRGEGGGLARVIHHPNLIESLVEILETLHAERAEHAPYNVLDARAADGGVELEFGGDALTKACGTLRGLRGVREGAVGGEEGFLGLDWAVGAEVAA